MKILFTRFPLESAFGGAEVQTLSLMKELGGRGYEVGFLGSCPVLLERTQGTGLKTHELRVGNPPVTKWGVVSFLWRKRGMRRKLIKCFDTSFDSRGLNRSCGSASSTRSLSRPSSSSGQHDMGVVFMLSLSEKLLLTDYLVSQGVQVFWIEHDRVGRWLTKNPWLPRLKKLSEQVTTVVVSDLSKEIYVKMGWPKEKVVAIPNGVDVDRFALEGRKTQDTRHTCFRIGCIARLTRDKGVDVLIEAIKDIPNVELTIVGQGPERGNIQNQISKINRTQDTRNRTHVDLISSIDAPSFYKQIDCLILPSRDHDPFGLVIAEAMAAGIPTICTDACGIAAHLDESESIIIPADNINALHDAIIKIQDKEVWSKLSEIGPRVAKEKFSLERMIEEYSSLL